jgi:hypothetical protein
VNNPNGYLQRAGQWLLQSGIQSPEGGVARYYRSDLQRNNPVSTEITGYSASALAYLHKKTGATIYLERAVKTAQFLARQGWNRELQTFPFEWPELTPTYFFDCGIIVRGLMAVWRLSKEDEYLDAAAAGARAMGRDFASAVDFHPILELPSKHPAARDSRWSRSSGCYQLKAALAWLDLADVTGDKDFRAWFDRALEVAIRDDAGFLPGADDEARVMDRLHAYLYYLEALTRVGRNVSSGIERVAGYLHDIAPRFVRSDVYAQLLRVRLISGTRVDDGEAENRELARFQASSADPRIDGGFYFGMKGGSFLPYVNPVSTTFGLQAMRMWDDHKAGLLTWDGLDLV